MKVIQILLLSIFLIHLPIGVQGQSFPDDGIDWTGVQRALELADSEEKLILIDVYAAWCPYCQRMQTDVYPSDAVREKIAEYFIPVRINVESDNTLTYLGNRMTEAEFARALRYRSVPTTYFMNREGAVVGQQPGYLEIDMFTALLEYVGSGAFESLSFDEFERQRVE